MELEKFNRQLKLIALLAGNASLTVDALAGKLGMSRRTVYRYINLLRQSPLFEVEHSGDVFRIGRNSAFVREISDNLSLSEDEAAVVAGLVASARGSSLQMRSLRNKLERIYNYRVLDTPEADSRTARNLSRLYEAVKQHRVVVLKDYRSLNGSSVSDRVVEPFAFINSNDDVRCYELATRKNKTFKVARAGDVTVLDLTWSNADRHDKYYSDLFGFSGTETTRVVLHLSMRAAAILREEHPAAAACLTPCNDGSCTFDTEVCGFRGLARFVLGLYSEIDIVEPQAFKDYMRSECELLTKKFGV